MSTNTIFVILAAIIIIALVIYLIAVKKGKSQQGQPVAPSAMPEDEEDEEI